MQSMIDIINKDKSKSLHHKVIGVILFFLLQGSCNAQYYNVYETNNTLFSKTKFTFHDKFFMSDEWRIGGYLGFGMMHNSTNEILFGTSLSLNFDYAIRRSNWRIGIEPSLIIGAATCVGIEDEEHESHDYEQTNRYGSGYINVCPFADYIFLETEKENALFIRAGVGPSHLIKNHEPYPIINTIMLLAGLGVDINHARFLFEIYNSIDTFFFYRRFASMLWETKKITY